MTFLSVALVMVALRVRSRLLTATVAIGLALAGAGVGQVEGETRAEPVRSADAPLAVHAPVAREATRAR